MTKLWLVAFITLSWSAAAMDLELDGKQALVTGSTSGIGYAIAEALLREGADVVVNGRSQETVDAAIERLKAATGRTAQGFAADMATPEGTAAIHAAFPNVDTSSTTSGATARKRSSRAPTKTGTGSSISTS